MTLTKDGFDLTFTEPVDKALAGDISSYKMESFRYIYQESYGSPEVDQAKQVIKSAAVGDDGKSVHLTVDNLQPGAVHTLHADAIRSADGKPLLHNIAWYSLWQFMDDAK